MADVIAYSSCKGLCGLTGASFIAYNDLKLNEVESFYLNIDTHLNKSVTALSCYSIIIENFRKI